MTTSIELIKSALVTTSIKLVKPALVTTSINLQSNLLYKTRLLKIPPIIVIVRIGIGITRH
jgi:hypothetical protein